MKRILGLTALLVIGGFLTAAEQSVVKPKPPQSVIPVKSGCVCTNCRCVAGECGDPFCLSTIKVSTPINEPGPVEWAIYEMQYQRALKGNMPLLIWVGVTCPKYETAWTQYVHAHLSEYHGETGPEVIVCHEDGLGGMTIAGRLAGIPTLASVQGLLKPRSNPRDDPTWGNPNPYNTNPHWPYQAVAPVSLPLVGSCCGPMGCGPMIGGFGMPMGGFGGGCAGCGGGR